MQKSRRGVWYRVEEGEGARPASKRSIVQRTGKCSAGCSAHVQSLRPVHLCVHPCIYSRSHLDRRPSPLFSFLRKISAILTPPINWRSVVFFFSYEEEIERERNLNAFKYGRERNIRWKIHSWNDISCNIVAICLQKREETIL